MIYPALTLALLAALGPDHNPRTSPTRLEHALFMIPGVTGPVVPVGDVDGDGIDDLIVQRHLTIALHSGRDGVELRLLAELSIDDFHWSPSWAVGPDLDGDGIRDFVLIVSTESRLAIELHSGRTGATIATPRAPVGRPRTVVWLDDIDGDGAQDLAFSDAKGTEVVLVSGATWSEIWRMQTPDSGFRAASLQNVGDRSGDGVDDLLLNNHLWLGPSVWISGKDGATFDDALGDEGHFFAIGDLDADGLGDVISDGGSGPAGVNRFEVKGTAKSPEWTGSRYPDTASDYPVVRSVGDIDGDGVPDLGVGDTNFNLRADGEITPDSRAIDLSSLTLAEAFAISSRPSSVSSESGCVWILSGRTGEGIMGVWGEPGGAFTENGAVGIDVFGLNDQNGDGWRDIAVLNGQGAYIFSTAPTVVLSDDPFDWLPGRWQSRTTRNNFTRVSEETWLAPAAGLMPGISRSYTEGASSGGSFEFLRIERTPDTLTLIAQPGGGDATRFEATEVGPGWVLFMNPKHDFPTRILYQRVGNKLSADVGTADKPHALRFRWTRTEGRR